MKSEPTPSPRTPGPAIDWENLHQRMEAAQTALEGGFAPTPESRQAILRARAKALALEPEERPVEPPIEAVTFLLAHETYAVETAYVSEVYPLREFTPLPGVPLFVLGIVNLRGRILSVVDLKKFFDLPERGLTDLNKVIVLRSAAMEFGILADAVPGVLSIAPGDLQPSLPTLTGIRGDYLKGITSERLILLDAGRLLADPAMIVYQEEQT